jgi:hypothetical protein
VHDDRRLGRNDRFLETDHRCNIILGQRWRRCEGGGILRRFGCGFGRRPTVLRGLSLFRDRFVLHPARGKDIAGVIPRPGVTCRTHGEWFLTSRTTLVAIRRRLRLVSGPGGRLFEQAKLGQPRLDKGDAFVEGVVLGRQSTRPFERLDRGHPLIVDNRRLAHRPRRDRVFRIELECAFERNLGTLGVAVVELCAAEADPGRDIAGMFLETGAQNLDRLVELTLPAEVLAELEEDPGGRILPEFESLFPMAVAALARSQSR